jgi:nitrite reductase (NO-forming)
VYSSGLLELALAFGIIFGFLRKLSYTVSLFLSLIIWAVPEGFGGPYGPGSSDIGTGIAYAIVSLMLLVMNATFGPSRYSLDFFIERKWRWWKKIAEIKAN